MKRLRKPQRVDRITSEARPRRGGVGRWIYLGLVAGFIFWVADLFVGSYFMFRAEGLVHQESATIAVTYPARVIELYVAEGDHVDRGQPLAKVFSISVLEQITALSIQLSELRRDEADLAGRSTELAALLPIATKRAHDMTTLRKKEETSVTRGLTSDRKMSELLEREFDAVESLESMRNERANISAQIGDLQEIRKHLAATLSQIESAYDDGIVRADVDGVVNAISANVGTVVPSGEQIADMLFGDNYVLAYVKPGSFATVESGDTVDIAFGVERLQGRVDAILPFSQRLPKEFQRAFRPTERGQITRIAIVHGEAPATFTKVLLTEPWYGLDRLFARLG